MDKNTRQVVKIMVVEIVTVLFMYSSSGLIKILEQNFLFTQNWESQLIVSRL